MRRSGNKGFSMLGGNVLGKPAPVKLAELSKCVGEVSEFVPDGGCSWGRSFAGQHGVPMKDGIKRAGAEQRFWQLLSRKEKSAREAGVRTVSKYPEFLEKLRHPGSSEDTERFLEKVRQEEAEIQELVDEAYNRLKPEKYKPRGRRITRLVAVDPGPRELWKGKARSRPRG